MRFYTPKELLTVERVSNGATWACLLGYYFISGTHLGQDIDLNTARLISSENSSILSDALIEVSSIATLLATSLRTMRIKNDVFNETYTSDTALTLVTATAYLVNTYTRLNI